MTKRHAVQSLVLVDSLSSVKNTTVKAEADAMNMAEENSNKDDAKSSNKSTKIDNIVE